MEIIKGALRCDMLNRRPLVLFLLPTVRGGSKTSLQEGLRSCIRFGKGKGGRDLPGSRIRTTSPLFSLRCWGFLVLFVWFFRVLWLITSLPSQFLRQCNSLFFFLFLSCAFIYHLHKKRTCNYCKFTAHRVHQLLQLCFEKTHTYVLNP